MEAIAISPAPQPTTPQASKTASSSSQSDSDFGSTLSQTIEQQNASSEQASQAKNNQDSTATNSNSNPNQDSDNQNTEEQLAGLFASLPTEQNKEIQSGLQTSLPDIQGSKSNLGSELFFSKDQIGSTTQAGLTHQIDFTSQTETKSPIVQLTQPTTPIDTKPQAEQQNSLLLNKIQQIIASSNEAGVVSIRGDQANPTTTASTGTPNNAPVFPIIEETVTQASFSATSNSRVVGETDTSKSISKVASLRQEGQQTLAQDIKSDNNQNSNNNSQQSFSESSSGQQGFTANTTAVSASTSETTTSFTQVSSQVIENNSQQLQATSKTGLTTPNTAFQDNEVMNQLIQRFNVNPRLQTSKLSIQLNPVELGQLKIDILVKGDSIKANIVAQSQQAAEIIEKNMLKLKSVLEDSGFSIDDLIVSTAQEGGESFNLFDENYSQPEQFSQSDKKNYSNSNFELPLDEMLAEDSAVESSGVNVKI